MTLPTIPPPPSVFLDSSVFFAAAYSVTGSAHDLVLAGIAGKIPLVLSTYVLEETERNLRTSAPRVLPAFARLCQVLPYALSTPDLDLVTETARVIAAKDAPIIAAARAARAPLVATYDRKDLLANADLIARAFGITVATPDDILRQVDRR